MQKEDIKLYSWVIRGSQRREIIKVMDGVLTPTQIRKLTGFGLNNTSDVLRLFVKHKIAKCLNENEKLGRLYVLTEKGQKIKKSL